MIYRVTVNLEIEAGSADDAVDQVMRRLKDSDFAVPPILANVEASEPGQERKN